MQFNCPSCDEPIDYSPAAETREAGGAAETIDGLRCTNCGFVAAPPDARGTASFEGLEDGVGTQIAHFTLISVLGRGSFGTVWLANDVTLQRQVALKLAIPRQGESGNLIHEAQAAARLRHANIVAIHEVGNTQDDQVYIASEYIDGLTLRDLLSKGRPKVETAVALLAAVSHALHHAHEHGIVHRDVKPANILIDGEGQPHVADFGIAKRIAADATISTDGQVVGTALYMSPEQASGMTRETDRRADVYALGVMLFEMLTGHVPFRGNTRAVLHQKVFEEAPSPRALIPSLPRDLETICVRCLEREPSRRYGTAEEVARELERFLEGVPIEARPITRVERGWRWCRRRPLVAGLLLGLFLSLTGGLAGVTFFWRQSEAHAQRSEQHARRTGESLYRSQMKLASEYLAAGDLAGVRSVIERFDDGQPFADLRGFEWRYFDRVTSIWTEVVNLGDVVVDVAISLDGEFCAACIDDGRIGVWECRTGKLVRELAIEPGRIRSLAFSPTSNDLLAGGTDGFLRIWNPIVSDRSRLTKKHGKQVQQVAYSPDGRQVLSRGSEGAVRIWNAADLSLVDAIPSGQGIVKDARFSPDGERLAVATDDDLIRIWRIGTRPPLRVIEGIVNVEHMDWSADGTSIVTGSYNGIIRVRSVEDDRMPEAILGDFRVGDIEFLRDTPIVAALTNDNGLRMYDTAAHREINRLMVHNLGFGVMAVSADGRHAVIGSGDGSVRTIATDELLRRDVQWIDSDVRSLAFVADDKRFVAAGRDGVPHLRDTRTGEAVDPPPPADPSKSPADLVLVTAPTVMLLDRATGAVVHELEVEGMGVTHAALAPDGRTLAVVRGGPIRVFDVGETIVPRYEIPLPDSPAVAFLFLAAAEHEPEVLAIADEDRTIRFHAAGDGTARETTIELDATPRALTACEGGRVLAIGTDLGTMHLWDRRQNRMRSVFKAHAGRINTLATLPNGTTIVSGGRDRSLVLSDSVTGEPIAKFFGHSRQVFSVAVSRNGRTIASGGLDGDVRIWRSGGEPGRPGR